MMRMTTKMMKMTTTFKIKKETNQRKRKKKHMENINNPAFGLLVYERVLNCFVFFGGILISQKVFPSIEMELISFLVFVWTTWSSIIYMGVLYGTTHTMGFLIIISSNNQPSNQHQTVTQSSTNFTQILQLSSATATHIHVMCYH